MIHQFRRNSWLLQTMPRLAKDCYLKELMRAAEPFSENPSPPRIASGLALSLKTLISGAHPDVA